jgi:hypothetical protein
MMGTKYLLAVERWTLVLAAMAIAVALLAHDRRLGFGVSVGAALGALNAWLQNRVGQRAFRTFKKPGATILLLNLKMALLMALVFVVIHFLHVDAVGVLIGISVFPVAIVVVAIRQFLSPPPPEGEPRNGESHG